MGKTYQVMINGIKGEKITVDVGNSEDQMKNMTVLELKKKIALKLPGTADDDLSSLRLIFTDKQLEDSCQLSSYGIQDKSVIQLVIRLPGGAQLPQ
ncbi:ubiquitin-40S ribosomal protein S27a-like [Brienomyrus brachyistius]|uniref:ubiquitin-40S ribosomal protein S27a-like n=1 Tax=Brienomyrus brachyistius TaxID=42636 RepID=UPI0020B1D41C|nr:ubiquitin-40S ribosomal protein S27a-like [Brienomyrus brachyistius]